MNILEMYILLEYSAIIPIIAGVLRWKYMSPFLKCQVLALSIMLLGDFFANSTAVVSSLNSLFFDVLGLEISPENNLFIYFISYSLSLTAIFYAWLNVPEYNTIDRKRIYIFSVISIAIIVCWSIFQNWFSAAMFFQDYAFFGLLHTAVLLALSLQFFHTFLNTETFEPELRNPLFFVAFAHMVFAVPSTFIILLSSISSSAVATDIWIGREISYCISNIIIVLAFFVKK